MFREENQAQQREKIQIVEPTSCAKRQLRSLKYVLFYPLVKLSDYPPQVSIARLFCHQNPWRFDL